ncbi:MAG: ADP-forming succinate--CoA ligase subunit beta [Clostridia bacterium]|nr:ADP-forming succinate--CoA ligase subunit beta [Clostridia bacterium]
MKIHEYQALALLSEYEIPNSGGLPADTPEQAYQAALELGGTSWVVKAQIYAGGRGKAGGVKFAASPQEAKNCAEQILGMRIVNKQTGPQGRLVRKVLVTNGLKIAKEYYLSMVLDSANAKIMILASAEGGSEIEEIAALNPEKIFKIHIDPMIGLRPYHLKELEGKLGITDKQQISDFAVIVRGIYRIFVEKDCSLLEINPLVLTAAGRMMVLDIKMSFDGNALFRHPEIAALRDLNEEDPKETEAAKYKLNYIPLEGNIGCMVNGAGLAMATMDIIKAYGAEPANFLDVGGGTSAEKVAGALRILLSDPNIKGILINIFGGIVRCDVLAQGICEAARQVKITVPIVVRLAGTNADEGKRILNESGLSLIAADNLGSAVEKIVWQVQGGSVQ